MAPPELAVIVAVPLAPPAKNVTVARPLMSVVTSDGSRRPSVVVNDTCVPLCGGVPAASITCALICVAPLAERAVAEEVSVMVEPVGARSGTRSQEAARHARAATANAAGDSRYRRANIKTLNILLSWISVVNTDTRWPHFWSR